MRVLVVDDHPVVRKGIIHILEEDPGVETCVEAGSSAELMERLAGERWDVVVLDINLPDRNGLDVLRDLKAAYPRLPVLVLSVYPEDQYAVMALRAGAAGYLPKDGLAEELLTALHKVASGGRYITQHLAERLAENLVSPAEEHPHQRLSEREFQVLLGLASGKRLKDIARDMSLSVKTVSTYRARVLEKMGMANNAQLTQYALRHNLLP
ncbi:response regulator transcription factor [Candidatus Solincola tengchongensis]|uniref:response regulator n=1 Tax=Candidatus Solincola tengchongensis TaxID=2900693 RepID=UPI00257E761B|nr:response regulator transcription factor [Candidatus Solincola tengchongensis]